MSGLSRIAIRGLRHFTVNGSGREVACPPTLEEYRQMDADGMIQRPLTDGPMWLHPRMGDGGAAA